MDNSNKKALVDFASTLLQINSESDKCMLEFLEEDSSSSSSSDDSDEGMQHPKVVNFVEVIDRYGDEDFRSNMRLKRSTVEYLIERYVVAHPRVDNKNKGKPRIGGKAMMYMYIWYMSNTITYRQLANLFGVTKSTSWLVVQRIAVWIVSIGEEFLTWPTGAAVENISQKFKSRKQIPGVIGAIDGTHIPINAPLINKECFFDRKQNYSLILQAVVGPDKRFTSVYCGEPGSMHDSRVLRRSGLYRLAEENVNAVFPNDTFLVGDSAYACTNWLVTPFKDNGQLTDQQKKFNFIHSSTRMVVENAFGLLKGRFRRVLKFTEHRNINTLTKIITSACILHNICIIKDDSLISDDIEEEEAGAEVEEVEEQAVQQVGRSANRRNILFNYLLENRII